MKLLNDFFSIEKYCESGTDFIYTIRLDASHFIFFAHFPNKPVTPGVCILQIAQEMLEHRMCRKLDLVQVNNIKYMHIISPLETPEIDYRFSSVVVEEDCCKAKVIVEKNDQTFVKISVTYKYE